MKICHLLTFKIIVSDDFIDCDEYYEDYKDSDFGDCKNDDDDEEDDCDTEDEDNKEDNDCSLLLFDELFSFCLLWNSILQISHPFEVENITFDDNDDYISLFCLPSVPCLMWLISHQVKITHLLTLVTRFETIVVDF